ncbi:hypothetical protein LTR37_010435 [Vermiconidia calcicola]|uniref:Uncharacterized protein n=1 Tax=Vermiconidia calcicola TaxID=1690605 RepID=A0ACC3N5L5_9PEZI|nr:hypothetical protein LTR37_010435 [Vermiconidia calcicola]
MATVATTTATTSLLTLVPLTTVFIPPDSCFSSATFTVSPGGNDAIRQDGTAVTAFRGVQSDDECYPTGYSAIFSASPVRLWYSPGNICPESYFTADLEQDYFSTSVQCCPTYHSFSAKWCWAITGGAEVTVINGSDTSTITAAIVASPPIAYRQATSDGVYRFPSTLSQSSNTSSTVDETSAPVTDPPTPPSPSNDAETTTSTGSGLSTGAKAGIGIGAVLGGIAIISLIVAAVWWRRRSRKPPKRGSYDQAGDGKAELSGEGKDKPEISGAEVYEAGGVGKPPELDQDNVRVELESDWRGWEASNEGIRPYEMAVDAVAHR